MIFDHKNKNAQFITKVLPNFIGLVLWIGAVCLSPHVRADYVEDKQREYNELQSEKEVVIKQLEIITGDEETQYIIVPGDTMSVSYTDRDKKVGAVYRVSDAGEITLPLVNEVKVQGLNRQQARALITQRMQEYIRNPQVEIIVNGSGRVMVLGEVNVPGVYSIQAKTTVMEAILRAGSYNKDSAYIRGVILVRGSGNDADVRRLNIHKMITKGDRTDDIYVKPGDLIYVPKTLLSDLTKFKDDVYKWVSLYYSYGRLPASPPVEDNQPVLYER